MKRMKPTLVSIGVVAYNEERTIETVLMGLTSQRESGWRLNEILVICDGCMDRTVLNARSFRDKRIRIVDHQTRRGKTTRLQELFRSTSGDMLVMFDADIELSGKDVVTKLIAPFAADEQIVLVGGNSRPHQPSTFFQKAVASTFEVFDRSRKEIRGGHNIFGCTGSILAIRNSFAQKVQFPPIINEDAYLYLLCKKQGHQFRYADDAVVHYRLPTRWTDHIRQMLRSTPASVNAELTPYFGDLVNQEFHRSTSFYLKTVWSSFLKNPIGVLLMAFLNISTRPFYPFIWRRYNLNWFTANSTHQP